MTSLQSTSTTSLSGTTTTIYTGSLDYIPTSTGSLTIDHFEFFKIKDGSYFVNYDTFAFLLVTIVVWILLMKTLINLFLYFFNAGFILSSWSKMPWKK